MFMQLSVFLSVHLILLFSRSINYCNNNANIINKINSYSESNIAIFNDIHVKN